MAVPNHLREGEALLALRTGPNYPCYECPVSVQGLWELDKGMCSRKREEVCADDHFVKESLPNDLI